MPKFIQFTKVFRFNLTFGNIYGAKVICMGLIFEKEEI